MKPHRAVPILPSVLCLGLGLALLGCSTGSGTATRPGFGSVRVSMTDTPGDYDEVNVVIREVRIHDADAGDEDGWYVVRPDSATSYDLLELQNGVFVTLGFAHSIPAGRYDQIRLVLGDGSNLVVAGATHPLVVPSGMQSGIKVNGWFEVPDGGVAEVLLDFDAARSVHRTGNGKYMLKPVIRMTAAPASGAIHGDLEPAVLATITVTQNADTVATTSPAEDGQFTVAALLAGTYSVTIDVAADYRDTTLAGVAVTAGQTTELGTVLLTPQ